MKCEEAAEYVSALCDGETVPRQAAEHMGICEVCRERLKEYAEMGAELRRVASLESMEQAPVLRWREIIRTAPNWWQKGWETMRIPRFAFVMLLVTVVVLSSGLVMMRARAHSQGTVLMLTAKTASGRTIHCALSLEDRKFGSFGSVQQVNGATELYGFRFISMDRDRIALGVRAKRGSDIGSSSSDVDKLPESTYWLQPGENLNIDVPGSGNMVVTGELMDHMPPFLATMGEQLDPSANELRFVDPVVLRGKQVVHDFEGITVSGSGEDEGIELYTPRDGRYEISLSQLEGAAEGKIKGSRISFELNGQPYVVLTGAPVARGQRIWILHLPNRPSDDGNDHGSASYMPMTQYLAKPQAKN